MMNMERAALKGQLQDAKKEFNDLDLLAAGQIIAARGFINPYTEDVTLLETEKALAQVNALHETVEKMRTLKTRIKKLEDALHG